MTVMRIRAETKQACLVLLRLIPTGHRPSSKTDQLLEELPERNLRSFQTNGINFKEDKSRLVATPWLCGLALRDCSDPSPIDPHTAPFWVCQWPTECFNPISFAPIPSAPNMFQETKLSMILLFRASVPQTTHELLGNISELPICFILRIYRDSPPYSMAHPSPALAYQCPFTLCLCSPSPAASRTHSRINCRTCFSTPRERPQDHVPGVRSITALLCYEFLQIRILRYLIRARSPLERWELFLTMSILCVRELDHFHTLESLQIKNCPIPFVLEVFVC